MKREELEASALAAGFSIGEQQGHQIFVRDSQGHSIEWNPYQFGNQTLFLIAKLKLKISFFEGERNVVCVNHIEEKMQAQGDDDALRRAVIKAAASLALTETS